MKERQLERQNEQIQYSRKSTPKEQKPKVLLLDDDDRRG